MGTNVGGQPLYGVVVGCVFSRFTPHAESPQIPVMISSYREVMTYDNHA
jgi:hypothetical protein